MSVLTPIPSAGLPQGPRVIVFRLADILDEKGWTPYRLAKESGIPQPTVYRLLSDRTHTDSRISFRTLDVLCETLNCTVADILAHVPGTKRSRR
jgi:DNA-binding Xre family transcriptional regulator